MVKQNTGREENKNELKIKDVDYGKIQSWSITIARI